MKGNGPADTEALRAGITAEAALRRAAAAQKEPQVRCWQALLAAQVNRHCLLLSQIFKRGCISRMVPCNVLLRAPHHSQACLCMLTTSLTSDKPGSSLRMMYESGILHTCCDVDSIL